MKSLRTIKEPPKVYSQEYQQELVRDLRSGVPPKRVWEPYVEVPLWQNSASIPIYTARVPMALRELLLWSAVKIVASTVLYTTLDIVISGQGSILRKPWSTGGGIEAEEVVNVWSDDEEAETGGGSRQIERGQTVLVRIKHYSMGPVVGPVSTSESEQEREEGEPPEEVGALATEMYLQVVHEAV